MDEEPLELQIENDEEDDSPAIANASEEILQVWNWIYKGFRTVRFELKKEILQLFRRIETAQLTGSRVDCSL